MAVKFCPGKLTAWEDDPKKSGAREPKPGVLVRESLDGVVKRQVPGRGFKGRRLASIRRK